MALEKLVVMVKAPRPGTVKTRLARSLGALPACQAYMDLVACLLNNLGKLPSVELRFAPDDARHEIDRWLIPEWSARPQGSGDLGQRLTRLVEDSFADGPARLVILGSDCPWVTEADVREAWRQLERHDVVIGPAHDGGYWLIGMNQPQSSLFERIPWSSGQVFQQTLDRVNERKLSIHCLRALTDVDEEIEWQEFQANRKG